MAAWPGGQSGEVALVNFWRTLVEENIPPFEGVAMNIGGYTPLCEPFMLDNLTGEKYTLPKGLQDLTSYLSYFDAYVEAEINTSFQVLIDTAKNGWGGVARPTVSRFGEQGRVDKRPTTIAWCNASGAGLGEFPLTVANSQRTSIWVKPPGTSDGNQGYYCDSKSLWADTLPEPDAPAGGEWFHDYFTQLVANANPVLVEPAVVAQPLPLAVKVQALTIPVLSKADVAVTAALPEGVLFSALSINYSGQAIALPEPWQGLNSVQITADRIPASYFFDELRFNARGDNGQDYAAVIPLTDRQPFDGSPATDVVLDGQGGFTDFYRPYQAELADYTYSNNGYAGDDFLVGGFGGAALSGGDGDDYLQAGDVDGGRGDDTLVFWHSPNVSYARGGDGNDIYHVTTGSVVILTDTPGDTDIVYNIRPLGDGQRYVIDVATQDRFQPENYSENDLMIMVVDAEGDYVRRLFLHNFFADVPHFAAVHLADGQVITPETARAIIWPVQSSSVASSSSTAASP